MHKIWLGDTVEILDEHGRENRVGEVVHICGDRLKVKSDGFPFPWTTNINKVRRVAKLSK